MGVSAVNASSTEPGDKGLDHTICSCPITFAGGIPCLCSLALEWSQTVASNQRMKSLHKVQAWLLQLAIQHTQHTANLSFHQTVFDHITLCVIAYLPALDPLWQIQMCVILIEIFHFLNCQLLMLERPVSEKKNKCD